MIRNYFTIFLMILLFVACSKNKNNNHDEHNHGSVSSESKSFNDTFPFEVFKNEIGYVILLETDNEKIKEKYNKIWMDNNYSGDGYCWNAHINNIIEQKYPSLLNKIKFNPEKESFGAFISKEEDKKMFIASLKPILNNLSSFEKFVKEADKNKINSQLK